MRNAKRPSHATQGITPPCCQVCCVAFVSPCWRTLRRSPSALVPLEATAVAAKRAQVPLRSATRSNTPSPPTPCDADSILLMNSAVERDRIAPLDTAHQPRCQNAEVACRSRRMPDRAVTRNTASQPATQTASCDRRDRYSAFRISPSEFRYRSNSAAMMFSDPRIAGTSEIWWPSIILGNV